MADPHGARASLADADEASRFVAGFLDAMARLGRLLDEQTAQLASGRLRDGLAHEALKTELAGTYLTALERARANAVAIARFAPGRVAELRRGHEAFRAVVERNQTVIATARAVSEGLVRGVADEMARRARPQGYGATPAAAPARPLAYSGLL